MKKYKYEIIADKIGNKGGHGSMKPHAITIHHSAVKSSPGYDVVGRAKQYAAGHGGNMPYHFFIPYDDSEAIYCTQFVNQYTWHNSNLNANKDTIAICLDGNFEEQSPRPAQLEKLKQLLDDLSDNWFSKNGWVSFETGLNPKSKDILTYSDNKKVNVLHWHNEVAQKGYPTDCCGDSLMPYVRDYRNNAGKVNWGAKEPEPVITVYKVTENGAGIAENQDKGITDKIFNTLKGRLYKEGGTGSYLKVKKQGSNILESNIIESVKYDNYLVMLNNEELYDGPDFTIAKDKYETGVIHVQTNGGLVALSKNGKVDSELEVPITYKVKFGNNQVIFNELDEAQADFEGYKALLMPGERVELYRVNTLLNAYEQPMENTVPMEPAPPTYVDPITGRPHNKFLERKFLIAIAAPIILPIIANLDLLAYADAYVDLAIDTILYIGAIGLPTVWVIIEGWLDRAKIKEAGKN